MICQDVKCKKLKDDGSCSVYNKGGQEYRDRYGYCPIPDAGPNKVVNVADTKKRAGQQKQKKR